MITIWALTEEGNKQEELISLGKLAALFDLYSCIAVNIDTATWIKVIYWIFFGILCIASVIGFLYISFSDCEDPKKKNM